MIAAVLFGFGVGFVIVAWFVGREMLSRFGGRTAFELGLEPTCLLCDSHELDAGEPPQYRCLACGFDTQKAATLQAELEIFRDLGYALDELDLAGDLLDTARFARRETADECIAEATRHQMEALSHLEHVIDHEESLLDLSFASEDDSWFFRGANARRELDDYMDLLEDVRDGIRRRILGQMTADGDPGPRKLDFEHAVAADYDTI